MVTASGHRRRIIAALLSVLLGSGPAATPAVARSPAEEPPIGRGTISTALPPEPVPAAPRCGFGQRIVPVRGIIDRPMIINLRSQIAGAVRDRICKVTVELDSPGGMAVYALNAAWFLDSLPEAVDVTTMVPPGGRCDSSCTMIYAAGRRRVAAEDAVFLFHPVQVIVLADRHLARVPEIEQEITGYWTELIRKADRRLARILVRARAFRTGGRGRPVIVRASGLRITGRGWVTDLVASGGAQAAGRPSS